MISQVLHSTSAPSDKFEVSYVHVATLCKYTYKSAFSQELQEITKSFEFYCNSLMICLRTILQDIHNDYLTHTLDLS